MRIDWNTYTVRIACLIKESLRVVPEGYETVKAIPHNSTCRYGERGAPAAKQKAQIILCAAKVSAACGGYSEPEQGQRSQNARGAQAPKHDAGAPQPVIIEHFCTADGAHRLSELWVLARGATFERKRKWGAQNASRTRLATKRACQLCWLAGIKPAKRYVRRKPRIVRCCLSFPSAGKVCKECIPDCVRPA